MIIVSTVFSNNYIVKVFIATFELEKQTHKCLCTREHETQGLHGCLQNLMSLRPMAQLMPEVKNSRGNATVHACTQLNRT